MPTPDSSDPKAKLIRDRTAKLLASASLHAERIGDAAGKLGLTPSLFDDLGDLLYESVVAQLDVASKILERSQTIADHLLDLGAARPCDNQLIRVDVMRGQDAQVRFVVSNRSLQETTVDVIAKLEGGDDELNVEIGRRLLPGGRQTSVAIAIPTSRIPDPGVYAGAASIGLIYNPGGRTEQPRCEFEIWVAARG